jgi:hypothetical protein
MQDQEHRQDLEAHTSAAAGAEASAPPAHASAAAAPEAPDAPLGTSDAKRSAGDFVRMGPQGQLTVGHEAAHFVQQPGGRVRP